MPGKLLKVTEMAGFGTSFGRLIREKRGIEGLSQEELAARAALTKARVSDLENGKINNPQAKTVDALCVALNISRDERTSCHDVGGANLPPRLLENLALRFGHSNPNALEDELVAFLKEKALEFSEMRSRLAALDAVDSAVARLVGEASAALENGEFPIADAKLAEAERAQLSSTTLPALEGQSRLRFERARAALLAGDVGAATEHWEAAANYFHFFDVQLEADCCYETSIVLREYAYRYRSADALYSAEATLGKALQIWSRPIDLPNWSKAMNGLGGVYWRLSQFDDHSKFDMHLMAAKAAYAAVRENTSPDNQPYYFAISAGNLANILCDTPSSEVEVRAGNLLTALDLQISAAGAIDRNSRPEEWGIFQHNLGCTYTKLFGIQRDKGEHLDLIDKAISHLELSFEVRDPEKMLQYWVASCRSLTEALITGSEYRQMSVGYSDLERAGKILGDALSRISEPEHPNQWSALKEQERRLQEVIRRANEELPNVRY